MREQKIKRKRKRERERERERVTHNHYDQGSFQVVQLVCEMEEGEESETEEEVMNATSDD